MQGFRGLTQIGASRLLAPHCNNQYINQQRRWIVATQNGARLHFQWNRPRQNDAAAMLHRTDEQRVGKERVSTRRSRSSHYYQKNKACNHLTRRRYITAIATQKT